MRSSFGFRFWYLFSLPQKWRLATVRLTGQRASSPNGVDQQEVPLQRSAGEYSLRLVASRSRRPLRMKYDLCRQELNFLQAINEPLSIGKAYCVFGRTWGAEPNFPLKKKKEKEFGFHQGQPSNGLATPRRHSGLRFFLFARPFQPGGPGEDAREAGVAPNLLVRGLCVCVCV